MKYTLTLFAILCFGSAMAQTKITKPIGIYGTTMIDRTGYTTIEFSRPTSYDTIPSWLLTTERHDLSIVTQRKGYAIKPRDMAIGLSYGNYMPAELKTIAYLDANKKPVTNFIVWMSVRRKED